MCLYSRMEEKYKDKYRTTPARLTGWDYGTHGLYFITICTKDRVRYFGEIEEENNYKETRGIVSLRESEIGRIVRSNWIKIPEFSPFVELGEFVIMPDHMHGVLFINKPDKINWEANKFGVQVQNLASIIRGYKSIGKKIC
jgi:putative transposase